MPARFPYFKPTGYFKEAPESHGDLGVIQMSLSVLLSVAFLTCYAIGAPANIVPNPSAERVDGRGRPVGWGHYENTPALWGATEEELYTGKRCAFLKITGFGEDGYACTGLAVGETDGYTAPNGIPVKPNTTYHFSFYIAGYGFKRRITVHPWGFDEEGRNRDRGIKGIQVLPTPEWKRYVGTFTTKANTRRIVLMFFVYGMWGRDVEPGATFFVDDVYIGTQKPPPVKPARREIKMPQKREGEGYKPLKRGTVRIWDTNRKFSMKHYDFRAWNYRDEWTQVPYGVTDYRFRGDCVLEGENFWLSLHSSRYDSVFLYAKTDEEGTPSRHNELYRVFFTPTGLRNYGGGSQFCRILVNSPKEAVVYSEAITYERGGFRTTVTTLYRIFGGKPWLEIRPVWQADEQGMHGETRIIVAPEANDDGSDFVDDSLKRPGNYVSKVPLRAKMLLDLAMDVDALWVLIAHPLPEGGKLRTWTGTRYYAGNAPGGWHSGWSLIGEGDCDRVWTAPFAFFCGRPVYIGVLRPGYWHYQRIGRNVRRGERVTVNWRVVYQRERRGAPFKSGEIWRPLYPGKWRLIACIDGRYHTVPITITKDGTNSTLTFECPSAGNLEYVVFYLYDRTDETPGDVWTPMDIYRETMKGEGGGI